MLVSVLCVYVYVLSQVSFFVRGRQINSGGERFFWLVCKDRRGKMGGGKGRKYDTRRKKRIKPICK